LFRLDFPFYEVEERCSSGKDQQSKTSPSDQFAATSAQGKRYRRKRITVTPEFPKTH